MLQRISFEIAGEQQYARAFQVLAADARDLREPLGRTADIFRDSVAEQFATEGAHGLGSPWQPLSREYAEWKAQHYPGEPILQRTGDMAAAFTGPGSTIELTEDHLIWGAAPGVLNEDGTPVETYASAHQTGEGHMPQRKIVALSSEDRRRVDREFVEYFSSRTRRMAVL